ncbi:MAG TPA: Cof-type HAD-IIB family hydrolase [Candidatus Ruthenibacterium merdavium]|uniref:Cof-type HAD-IIB family hydrolase n=1 Tax=Candidatus Ruthenibacterium merdavium TaxID=2838752 RepID=A0A9D2Q4F9_9FIRM|nr:Cof-type HAD-IIB family hydrolase [Candidatus Ruthenibacterium merdavium]
MNYRMLVLDLDDTLLKDDRTVSELTRRRLLEAQQQGMIVVLASGRPTYAMQHLAKELCLAEYGGYFISFNGARITSCADQHILLSVDISHAQMCKLFDLAQEHGVYIQTYTEDHILVSKDNEYTQIEKEITGMDVIECADFKAEIPKTAVKAMMLEHPDRLKEVEKALRPVVENELYMTITKPFFLEFMNPAVDKGKSLVTLAQHLNVPMEQVIAVGDSYNDISMIKAAGLGVAMGNAVEAVKQAADYETADNEHDGVARVVERFFLQKDKS